MKAYGLPRLAQGRHLTVSTMSWLDTDSRSDSQIRQLSSHIRHSFQNLIHNIKLQHYLI